MPADSPAREATDYYLLGAGYGEDSDTGALARSAGYGSLTAALSIQEAS